MPLVRLMHRLCFYHLPVAMQYQTSLVAVAAAGLEWCGVANYSQRYMGGQMQAWGWSDTRCTTMGPFICKASPSMLAPSFTSKFTNSTFRLATYPSSFAAAQLGCNQLGGHLATYQLLQEQVG